MILIQIIFLPTHYKSKKDFFRPTSNSKEKITVASDDTSAAMYKITQNLLSKKDLVNMKFLIGQKTDLIQSII